MKLFVPLPRNRSWQSDSGIRSSDKQATRKCAGCWNSLRSKVRDEQTRKDQRYSQSEEDKINMDEPSVSWRVWPWAAGSCTCSIQSPEKDVACGCGIKLSTPGVFAAVPLTKLCETSEIVRADFLHRLGLR